MQNKEFDKLVESFLTPKTKLEDNNAFSLASLLSLVEEIEKAEVLVTEAEVVRQQIPTFIPQQQDVLSTDALKKYDELLKSDGVEAPDRQEFDKLLRQQLDSIVASQSDPLQKLVLFVKYLNGLKQGQITEKEMGKVFAAIIFAVSILKMIKEYASAPSAAGLLYERFIAYFFHGVMPAGTTIEDVIVGKEKWSLKLKSDTDISGSIDGMYEFFRESQNGVVKYLISQKMRSTTGIISYAVGFNLQQFENLLVNKGQKEKYENVKKAQETNDPIKLQIRDIQKKIDILKRSTTDNEQNEIINELENEKKRLASELVFQNSYDLQFSFTIKDLKEYYLIPEPIQLELSTEDVSKIMTNNSNLFNEQIKLVLEQVNAVANKVNNYLLSGEKEIGKDALNSVNSLGSELNAVISGQK